MSDICGDRQPGGTGFLCTLAPGHGGVMHEARARAATGGERTYAQWSTTMPRPQVRITPQMVNRADGVQEERPGTAYDQMEAVLRFAAEHWGLEVIE
jgi:hypothetical protein